MSIHPSLSSAGKGRQHRSVLKRFERLKKLSEKDKWHEGDSVFGLPKVKMVKIKIKKQKVAEEAAPAAAEGVTKEAPPAETASPKEKKGTT